MLMPALAALAFAIAKWWGPVGVAGIVVVGVAWATVRLRRLSPVVVLGCYVASYACLVRIDPAGGFCGELKHGQQMASRYVVCDGVCQILYRPVESIDRDLRREHWSFACVW
jgi:hypothetical protein